MQRLLIANVVLSGCSSARAYSRSGLHDPVGSVQGLIGRVLGPQYVSSFNLTVIPPDPATGFDVYELEAGTAGQIVLRGSAGFAIAAGLSTWLKYTANCSVSWGRNGSGNQVVLPPPGELPMPSASSRVVAPVRERYSYNVCTYGYSMAWWNFSQFGGCLAWKASADWQLQRNLLLPLFLMRPTPLQRLRSTASHSGASAFRSLSKARSTRGIGCIGRTSAVR